jgi:hypothetical protein
MVTLQYSHVSGRAEVHIVDGPTTTFSSQYMAPVRLDDGFELCGGKSNELFAINRSGSSGFTELQGAASIVNGIYKPRPRYI